MEIGIRSGRRVPFWAYLLVILVWVVISTNIIARFQLPVTLHSFKSQNSWLYIALYSLVLIVSTTSLFILNKKPFDLTAKTFFIFLQLFAMAGNFKYLFINEPHMLVSDIAFALSFNLYGVVLFHFNLIFPQPESIYKKYKRLIKVVYGIGFLFGFILSILMIIRYYGTNENALPVFGKLSRLSIAWMGLTLLAALGVAIHQFSITKNIKVRRQLRLVLMGSAVGLVSPVLFSIFPGYIWKMEPTRHLLTILEIANGIGTYIMTSFLVIAIFRYRIWNIEPFIRKAIVYSGATVIIYLSYLLLALFADIFTSSSNYLLHFFTLTAAVIIFILLKDKIQKFMDRMFHRESYNSVKVVKEFENNFAGIYKIEELKSGIVKFLNNILHFKSCAFVVKISDSGYKQVEVYGIESPLFDKEFALNFELEALLRKAAIFSIEEVKEIPKIIRYCHGELIVPQLTGDHLFGFLIIGPKLSGKSYSLQDIQLLALLSNRIISLFQTATLYQKDIERQLLLEHERTRIAKEMHDDVGASLTRISILASLLKNDGSVVGKTKVWLQQISDTSREIIQDMNQIIWALNTKNDTLEGLIAYIRRFAFEYFELSAVKCTFNLPDHLPQLSLKVEVRRNIYLIVREALNNVVKHAKAGIVEITISSANDDLSFLIRDNGIGFDPESLEFPGNGLINMKKRMNDLGGEFELTSKAGEGTVIKLKLPLNTKQELLPKSQGYFIRTESNGGT